MGRSKACTMKTDTVSIFDIPRLCILCKSFSQVRKMVEEILIKFILQQEKKMQNKKQEILEVMVLIIMESVWEYMKLHPQRICG